MADRSTPELGDVARVHWEPVLPRSGRARTASVAVVAGAALVVLVAGTALVVTERLSDLVPVLPALAAPLATLLLGRHGVELGPEGLRRRHGVVRRAWRPWADVAEVHPAGRWHAWPVAVLDRERVDLRGLASGDVERLAAALARARGGARGDAVGEERPPGRRD